jgi:NAD(P)-dependent dehydrogenase (short-subunit alcohol dehydrogenase family)
LADLPGDALNLAAQAVAAQSSHSVTHVLAVPTHVAHQNELVALHERVREHFGAVSVLMNNAGVGNNPGKPWENVAAWKALLDVNLWGVIHGVQAFVPAMLERDAPGVIINTGSKQGITSPPGNSAYNMSKAAVKNFTESLAHQVLQAVGRKVSVHLLIPGFTYTGMTGTPSKPEAAWTPEQVVDFMLTRITAGDFYILCPDHAVDRATDEKRMRWAMDDIIRNRPALSRWHPDHEQDFAKYMSGE